MTKIFRYYVLPPLGVAVASILLAYGLLQFRSLGLAHAEADAPMLVAEGAPYRPLYAQAEPPAPPPLGDSATLPSPAPEPAAAELPDPLEQPLEAASVVTRLWRSGAITSAIIVAAFFLLAIARAKIKWLGEGYRAVVVASAIGGLGFAAEAIADGATPNLSMVVIAVTTAIALAFSPKAPPIAGDV